MILEKRYVFLSFFEISFRYIETDRLLDAEGDSRFKSRDRRRSGRITMEGYRYRQDVETLDITVAEKG